MQEIHIFRVFPALICHTVFQGIGTNMASRSIETARKVVKGEIFFDSQLAAAFPEKRTREGRLQRMVKRGELVRLKRGLFAFSDSYRRGPIPTFYLANVLRGPSYISLESALSYHNLIPETVYAMTSVVLSRTSSFETPLGLFTYRLIPKTAFPYGVIIEGEGDSRFLIASKEKALVDKLYLDCHEADLFKVAVNSLRIDEDEMKRLNFDALIELGSFYNNKRFNERLFYLVERASL